MLVKREILQRNTGMTEPFNRPIICTDTDICNISISSVLPVVEDEIMNELFVVEN